MNAAQSRPTAAIARAYAPGHDRIVPLDGMELTHILVVADVTRARSFYRDVLGAEVYREYGGTSCVLRAFGTWLLLVTGGGPTDDKPTVTFAPPVDPDGSATR